MAQAQPDGVRGAAVYAQLPGGVESCLACHGPDPRTNPNNILRAAGDAAALAKALGTVSRMGYLRQHLAEKDLDDLAAYLASVARAGTPAQPWQVWPAVLDFGAAHAQAQMRPQFLRLWNPPGQPDLRVVAVNSTHPAFAVDHDCPSALRAGRACDVQVLPRPIAPTAPDIGAVTISVGGAGASGAVQAVGVSLRMVAGDRGQLVWRGEAGPVRLPTDATATATQNLTLVNQGAQPAVVGAAHWVGPNATAFTRRSGCDAGSVLSPGAWCEIQVAYQGAPSASAWAALVFASDGLNPAAVQMEAGAVLPPDEGPAPALPMPMGGGGCSIGPPGAGGRDITLLAALLAALARVRSRSSHRRSS